VSSFGPVNFWNLLSGEANPKLSQHGYSERGRAMRLARSKFRFICLESVSIQETKHRGAAHEVLLGPF